MKTIYGRVRCKYWNRSQEIETEVEDSATEEEISKALWDAAIEASGIECWQTDEDGNGLGD